MAPGEGTRHSMVAWFDIRQGLPLGINALLSTILGARLDYRLLESLGAGLNARCFNHAKDWEEGKAFWFDYMADTGDGWDSTCSMARLLTRESLELSGKTFDKGDWDWPCWISRLFGSRTSKEHEKANNLELPRGEFLILGGDEVYPYASAKQYRERLLAPFQEARETEGVKIDGQDRPYVYAIPGNHDWYDGLQSFMRRFTQDRDLGLWKTRQNLSYFSLKLPHGWWLWGVDTQLESDIDRPQWRFFHELAKEKMDDNDRLIVCTAEPYWIYAGLERTRDLENNFEFLLRKLHEVRPKVKVCVWLAGDLHLYRRHEAMSSPYVQRIVSGGGGAFLHPTHRPGKDPLVIIEKDEERKYKRHKQFPSQGRSWLLSFRTLIFQAWNPLFGLLPAVVYLVLGYGVSVDRLCIPQIVAQVQWFGVLVVTAACWAFCRAAEQFWKMRWSIVWGGLFHGGAHVAAVMLLAIGINALSTSWRLPMLQGGPWRVASFVVGGYLVGPFVFGLYLLLSVSLFGLHQNEAFSALRIPHYKNFLRIRINPDRTLDIFPIGLQCVHKDAKEVDAPILIEPRIHVNPDTK
jgi:hypothetical protein